MKRVKILVTGPFSSGKTSLIKSVSEIPVVSTEKAVTDETRVIKNQTTVALDFGRLTIDDDLVLYIFGTPGQERFSYMWDVLSVGAVGMVLIVDSADYKSIIEARRYLAFFLPNHAMHRMFEPHLCGWRSDLLSYQGLLGYGQDFHLHNRLKSGL